MDEQRKIHDFGRPYVPERDYVSNGYKNFGRPTKHFCEQCKDYYCDLKKLGVTNNAFPPICEGDISHTIQDKIANVPEDMQETLLYQDPVTFAALELNWRPRWYQLEMLRCTSQFKVVRAGRRLGKSECMAIKILHLLWINKDFSILLVCPYQSQVNRVFEIMRRLAYASDSFIESIEKDNTSAPQIMVLANGSKVTGFSSGAKSGGKSTQIRGQDANAVLIDEMDYLNEEDFEAILAILASHPDCILWASSTPTGERKQFFDWSVNKDLRFKEFHYISSESPSWRPEIETLFRDQYTEAGYHREFDAEFGEEAYGVFKNKDINASLDNYTYGMCEPSTSARYIVGVDWNENAGTHIMVVECDQHGENKQILYRPVEKRIIEKQEFTQHTAVMEVIRLTHKWNADWIYVDEGYGHTQIEMLKKFGLQNPASKIDKKVRGIQMGGNIEIRDPLTGEMIKKAAKPFIVNIAARQLETGRCILPRNEDTRVIIDEDMPTGGSIGLVQQMRNFRVEKIGKSGSPTYSQGFEHTLTAWMLALYGFFMELGDINKMNYGVQVGFSGRFGEEVKEPQNRVINSKKIRQKFIPQPRGLGYSDKRIFRRHDLLNSILEERTARIQEIENRKKNVKYPLPKPGNRSNF